MNCPNCNIEITKEFLSGLRCDKCGFLYFPNQKHIETCYAWLSVDPKTENEGFMAIKMPETGAIMAMVNSNKEPLLMLKDQVIRSLKSCNMNGRLVKFSNKEILEEIRNE